MRVEAEKIEAEFEAEVVRLRTECERLRKLAEDANEAKKKVIELQKFSKDKM